MPSLLCHEWSKRRNRPGWDSGKYFGQCLGSGGSAGSILKIQVSGSVPNFMAPLTSLFLDYQGRRLSSVPILHFGKKAGNMLWRDRRGYSMTFWAVFIGLVMIPASWRWQLNSDGIFMPFQKWQRQQTLQQLPLPLRSISKFFKIPEVLFPLQEPGERSGLCDFKYSQLIR